MRLIRGEFFRGGGHSERQGGCYARTRQIQILNVRKKKMAAGGNSKREHTPDPEEEEEDEFVGPIPIQKKTKKRRGLLIKYHCFISF